MNQVAATQSRPPGLGARGGPGRRGEQPTRLPSASKAGAPREGGTGGEKGERGVEVAWGQQPL